MSSNRLFERHRLRPTVRLAYRGGTSIEFPQRP